jgi:hypothetical protein
MISVPCVARAGFVLLGLAGGVSAQEWRLQTATGPAARQIGRLAYDQQRGELVLFGGNDLGSSQLADTWRFNGVAWSQATPANAPPPLVGHDLCHDPLRGVSVLFGGTGAVTGFSDQTWEWNGSNWLPRATAAAPSPRVSMAMAYDALRGVIVLFGGFTAAGAMADTWEYDGSNWMQRSPATVPPARARHAMAFDAGRSRLVMFGGGVPGLLGDTWEYDGVDWRPLATASAPPPQFGHRLVHDPVRGATVLVGGFDPVAGAASGTWELSNGEWHEFRQAGAAGGGATNLAAAFDASRSLVVTFGGIATTATDETWEFGGTVPSFTRFGSGCVGTAGRLGLDAMSRPALGMTWVLEGNGVPFGVGVLAASFASSPAVDLPGTACSVFLATPAALVTNFATFGVSTFAIGIPNSASLAGSQAFFQGAALDVVNPLGLVTSNAVRAVLH